MHYDAGAFLLDGKPIEAFSAEDILSRILSTKSRMSNTDPPSASTTTAHDEFREIGRGQCGTIWALGGVETAMKVPNSEANHGELWNDSRIHRVVQDAFQQTPTEFRSQVHVPAIQAWIQPSDPLWSENRQLLSITGLQPSYALLSEQIRPLPLPIRFAIVDALCPRHLIHDREQILADPKNESCLVRLYLGRRDGGQRRHAKTFGLRNFDLQVDEMERLRLPTEMYATAMADALAILHWRANVDANDIEFVLGSSPRVTSVPSAAEWWTADPDGAIFANRVELNGRSLHIFCLDFNLCKHFKIDDIDVGSTIKLLANGFWFNDPYYPRPASQHSADKKLWGIFRARYLSTSESLNGGSKLPQLFMDALEAEGKKRASKGNNSLIGALMM